MEPWERLFHNLRASRQTELADKFPAHVVARWLGNSSAIVERHYLQTIEAHYEAACQPICAAKSLQSLMEMDNIVGNERKVESRKPLDVKDSRKSHIPSIPPRGFEPLSPP